MNQAMETVKAAGGGFGGAPPNGYAPPPGGGGFGGAPPNGYAPPPGGGGFGGAPASPPGNPYGAPPVGAPMAGVPMGAVQQVKQVHTMAYVAIGCAIASWFVIPFLGAVVAIIAGTMARKEIKANPDKWTGDDYAKWGVIIGGVHIALWVVGIIGSLGMMLFCGGLSMLTH